MNISSFVAQIVNSSAVNWHVISCWGSGSGPSYRYELQTSTTYSSGAPTTSIDVVSHSLVATFKNDIAITIGWGLRSLDDFQEDWANGFPDPHASSSFVDMFYNGTLIYRELYVTVDGGRVALPVPEPRDGRLVVPSAYVRLVRLLNSLEAAYASEFDSYFQRAGMTEVDEPWPQF
ncbi:hypothetical protein [Sorangium sp. So ce406]|uniref:hypothetical protein n=1 Tax=Sorangium sp. So ce406 TaxID=3133311 RepID=UPI003F5AE0CC